MANEILFKLMHPNAQVPARATAGSAGFDLYACDIEHKNGIFFIDTCVAAAIPAKMVGKVYIRSGLASRGCMLVNGTGIIDSDYRGPIKLMIHKPPSVGIIPGDRVGQIVFVSLPDVEWVSVDELPATDRGVDGFGSTGSA